MQEMAKSFKKISIPGFDKNKIEIDNDAWFTTSWKLTENDWVIAWKKTSESKEIPGEFDYKPINYLPTKNSLKKKPFVVYNKKYGSGTVVDVVPSEEETFLEVLFENNKKLSFSPSSLSRLAKKYHRVNLESPIQRTYYIHLKDNKGKLLSLSDIDGANISIVDKIEGDQTTINEYIKCQAITDGVLNLLDKEAKWRKKPATDKQKNLLLKMSNKVNQNFSFNDLTCSDASALIDLGFWRDKLEKVFK